jgi:hypothetical protein
MSNVTVQLVVGLCSGVASSSSAEELERIYSGTSSIPKISLGENQG